MRLLVVSLCVFVFCIAMSASAYENRNVHPFTLSGNGYVKLVTSEPERYIDLENQFDRNLAAVDGYNPDSIFYRSDVLKPGTLGTIIEDDNVSIDGAIMPYLNHFWLPNDPDHKPDKLLIFSPESEALTYGSKLFSQGVEAFGVGRVERAFIDFGRALHVLEDMASPGHVFGDCHPGFPDLSSAIAGNGFETWTKDISSQQYAFPAPSTIEFGIDLGPTMEKIAEETFRSTRVSAELRRDPDWPATGDLMHMFYGGEVRYMNYVPKDALLGLMEFWHIDGIGNNYFGSEISRPDQEFDVPGNPIDLDNEWCRIANLPGESGEFYYLENNQDTVVPQQVWSLAEGAWVPNPGLRLAQLWAGVDGYRATPAQEQMLIPRATEYAAGYLKHLWDFVNPPPHLARVSITQEREGEGGVLFYDYSWVPLEDVSGASSYRRLFGAHVVAGFDPVTINLAFSEPVHNVEVWLGRDQPSQLVAAGASSTRGPPTDADPDGEDQLLLSDVNIGSLPPGQVRLFVKADDLSNHIGGDASRLDPDPGTRAARRPDGGWRRYWGEGGSLPEFDRNHSFQIASFAVRLNPPGRRVPIGGSSWHEVEVRNYTAYEGDMVALEAKGGAPGWSTNADLLDGTYVQLPSPESGWRRVVTLIVTNQAVTNGNIVVEVAGSLAGERQSVALRDWNEVSPQNDHPDDTLSVADPRYPTPWFVDDTSPVGILAGGWGAGLGHILGRYGIATALVDETLEALRNPVPGGRGIRLLLVGSGGLEGLDRMPSLREGLEEFVASGGVIATFTPKRGAELAALPGGDVFGYGWTEDQACFGDAVSVEALHPALAGQEQVRLDAGADGYLTRWPDEAEVLLRRNSNGQPAMIRYPFGRGEVFVLTLYPDWSYGSAQHSAAELALVRDLVTAALEHPNPVPLLLAGETASLSPTVHNAGLRDAATVRVTTYSPERQLLFARDYPAPLAPGGFFTLPLALEAPAGLGVHPATWTLLDAAGAAIKEPIGAGAFAVRADLGLADQDAGNLRIWATSAESVPCGGAAAATVHVRNDTAQEFRGLIAATWAHLGEGPVVTVPDVVVPPFGEGSWEVSYPAPPGSFSIRYALFEGPGPPPGDFPAGSVATAERGFTCHDPKLEIALAADAAAFLPGALVPLAVRLRNVHTAAASADLSLSLMETERRELWSAARPVTIESGGTLEELFSVALPADARGPCLLLAEARSGGNLIGQASISCFVPGPHLTAAPHLPVPWPTGSPVAVTLAVANDGGVPVAGAVAAASLSGPGGETVWEAEAPLPALAPGEAVEVSLPATLLPLRFGTHELRWETRYGGERTTASRRLRNRVEVAVDLPDRELAAGERLAGTVVLRNRGDFAGTLQVAIAAAALGMEERSGIDLVGEAAIPFETVVPEDVTPGASSITVTLRAADEQVASAPIFVPPGRLAILAPEAEALAGTSVGISLVNVGGARMPVDWRLRLLSCEADPMDPAAPALTAAEGALLLGRGEDAVVRVDLPADLPSGTYVLSFSSGAGAGDGGRPATWYVYVNGVAAALDLAADRPHYAPGETVTAVAGVENGGTALTGARLLLEVAGSATLAPVAFTGTLHVAPEGDDLLGDGSRERPLATVQAGVDRAAPGERVLLLPGSYPEAEVRLKEGTVLQGELQDGVPAARLEGTDVIGASGATIDRLRLVNAQVLFPSATERTRVSECVIEELDRGALSAGGVVYAAAAGNALVARNRFVRMQRARAGLWFLGPASGVVAVDNEFADYPTGRLGGIHFMNAAAGVVVQGNTLQDLAGDTSGIHFWGGAGANSLRGLRIVGNRLARLSGGSGGILFWADAQALEISGNELEELEGGLNGIHILAAARDTVVADNALRRFRGDATGIHCWGNSSGPDDGVEIARNLLEDFAPTRAGDSLAGIHVWRAARHLAIEGNLLRRVTDSVPEALESGIVLWGEGSSVAIARNVVHAGAAGVVLRSSGTGEPTAVDVAHNLFLDCGVGFHEWTEAGGGAAGFRDNVVAGAGRAGVLYRNDAGVPASSAVRSNVFHGNRADFEGRPDLVGTADNLGADPLIADAPAGDYRLLPGSPCADVATDAPLDIGPLDDDRGFLPGPGTVPLLALTEVHWRAEVPIGLAPGELLELRLPVEPITAMGLLELRGELVDASGRVLARSAGRFTRGIGPVLLALEIPKPAFRPGERIVVTGAVANVGAEPIAALPLRVASVAGTHFEAAMDLAPGASAPFSFELVAERGLVLHATAGAAEADLQVVVAAPAASFALRAPEVAGDEPFAVEAVACNIGLVPIAFSLDLDGERFDGTLEPAERRSWSVTRSIGADRTFVATLTGDLHETAAAAVRYGVAPRLAIRVDPVAPAGPVEATLAVANEGSVPARIETRVVLSGADGLEHGAWRPLLWVEPGATVEQPLLLGDLPPGGYVLAAVAGAASAETAFEVRPALLARITGFEIVGATASPPELTVELEVVNAGAERLAGSLELEGPALRSMIDLDLVPGESRHVRFVESLALAAPGNHLLTARVAAGGGIVDSRSVALPLFPRFAFGEIPAEQGIEPGAMNAFAIEVANEGPVGGAFSLRLVAGDLLDATQVSFAEAGGTAAVEFRFPLPGDLPDLVVPAKLLLTDLASGLTEERGLTLYTVNAPYVYLSRAFDRAWYRDGDVARFTVGVGTSTSRAIPLRVLISHGGTRAWSEVVVGPVPSGSLPVQGDPGVPRLSPGQLQGDYLSAVLEVGDSGGASLAWTADASAGCVAGAAVRTGSVPNPDASWSAWIAAANGEPAVERSDRYLQYRLLADCPGPDSAAAFLEVVVEAPAGGRRIRHASLKDFAVMPVEVAADFAVDFASGDRVFFGAYLESGRSAALDVATIPRAGGAIALRPERDRYLAGEEVRLLVEAGEPGTVILEGPGWQDSVFFDGPGSREIAFTLPAPLRCGTYFVSAALGESSVTASIEVLGWSVSVMEALLDRTAYLPGEIAQLDLEVFSEGDLSGAALEVWLVDGGSFVQVGEIPIDLVYGPNRLTAGFPVGLAVPGPARCEFALWLPLPGVEPLRLTGGRVGFDLLAPNLAPTAEAGSDVVAAEREWVALDGGGSLDPDGDRLEYRWTQSAGLPVLLHGALTATPVFLAPEVAPAGTTLEFTLVVSDGREESPTSTVVVRIENRNRPPVAVAGRDATHAVGETALLDGSLSHDPDGDPLSFSWEFVRRPPSSGAALEDPGSVQPRFAVDRPGEYEIALAVSDGIDESESDVVRVSTVNSAPTADAGPDRCEARGATVTLEGGGSDDPDGDPIAFWSWSLVEIPPGSAAALAGADSATPSFTLDPCGDYVAELVVGDGLLASEPDTVRVSCANAAPVADAGPDRAARIGDEVALDGTASGDPDGDALSWEWSLLQAPAGSIAALDDPAAPRPAFVPDVVGAYAFTLVVRDEGGLPSAADGVVVAAGTNVAAATVALKPGKVRLDALPAAILVRIELPAGWSAADVDPDQAAITAVGAKLLGKPVRRLIAKKPVIVDRDADGLPELEISFPCKPLRKRLRLGRNLLTVRGPLFGNGSFVGAATLKAR